MFDWEFSRVLLLILKMGGFLAGLCAVFIPYIYYYNVFRLGILLEVVILQLVWKYTTS